MTVRVHSFRDLRHSTLSLILLVAFAGIAGCANDHSSGGMSSPPDWVVVPSGGQHAKSATRDYIANGGSIPCTECHGADLSGGTSRVSCFGNPAGCHHGPVSGWIATSPVAQNHGISAKQSPGSSGSGFVSCQICHGSSFSGGTSGVSCYTCHGVSAPHAPKPWRGLSGSPYTHTDTAEAGNAPVCYQCHAYTGTANPNNPHVPPTPAPTGTAPGCSNGTMCHNQAATAPHITGSTWLNAGTGFHGTDAKSDLTNCQGCHGTPGTINFNGGSAPTACSTCHTASKAHPTDWQGLRTINGVTITHRTSGNRDVACAICHNTNGPGTEPNPSAPSCFSASFTNALGQARSCHSGGPAATNHLIPFDNTAHYSVNNTAFTANCGVCHAVTGTSPVSGAPLCTTCHTAGSPLAALNCTSCHASPPNGGTGAVYANIAGAHAVHIALNSTGTPVNCNTCHNGLGTGTLNHYNRAKARVAPGDVAFPATYNAKSGASSFDNTAALSCSNVRCHGGQATPNWQTGTLNVNTQCTNCHVFGSSLGNPQYNSPYSGRHDSNPSHRTCTNCHNITTLAVNHFTTLGTTAMEGPASATILPAVEYNGTSCNPQAGGLTGCHKRENW